MQVTLCNGLGALNIKLFVSFQYFSSLIEQLVCSNINFIFTDQPIAYPISVPSEEDTNVSVAVGTSRSGKRGLLPHCIL